MSAMAGQFVWFDLMTHDLDGAKSFYADAIGWTIQKWSHDYEIWHAGEKGVGGLVALTADQKGHGVPASWLGYVSVEDVDAAVGQAQKLGGRVVVPGTDIPKSGRLAVIADVQGAVFGVFHPSNPGAPPAAGALGHFGWAELNTTDWKAAWKLYSELFGWRKTGSMDMGPEYGEYFMFGAEPEKSMGGMSNSANVMKAPAHWLHYVNVKSVDDAAKRIAARGGKVLNGPMDVPGGGTRIAQCMDPQGAIFAIMASQPR